MGQSQKIPQKRKYTMANKPMKRCSTTYVIREMKIKLKYNYIPIRIAKI